MGLPSVGLEGIYRNRQEDVADLLNERHKDHYMVFNLSQMNYDYKLFHDMVQDFGFPDHHPPELDKLFIICKAMNNFLNSEKNNVAVVHCKVILFICAFLL